MGIVYLSTHVFATVPGYSVGKLMYRFIHFGWIAIMLPTLFAQTVERPFYTDPSIAPNRAEVAFVSGGDIWVAPLAGGRGASAGVASGQRDAAPVFAGRHTPGVRFYAHRQWRYLRVDAGHGRHQAHYVRRRAGRAERMVTRRQVAVRRTRRISRECRISIG